MPAVQQILGVQLAHHAFFTIQQIGPAWVQLGKATVQLIEGHGLHFHSFEHQRVGFLLIRVTHIQYHLAGQRLFDRLHFGAFQLQLQIAAVGRGHLFDGLIQDAEIETGFGGGDLAHIGVDVRDALVRPRREPIAESEPATAQAAQAPASAASEPVAPEEVLVILVVARSEEGFPGAAMMQSIMESGLRYGDMNIFHRHESMTGNGDVLFSMANALKPGTFDLDELEHNHVRAVTFFMGLPGPRHPKQALDLMIASARKLSQELGGDLKDENRSVLTAQTIEHYRQRIAEFERKRFGLRR